LRLKIIQGALPGTVIYTETHTKTTIGQGLVMLEIGQGTITDNNSNNGTSFCSLYCGATEARIVEFTLEFRHHSTKNN